MSLGFDPIRQLHEMLMQQHGQAPMPQMPGVEVSAPAPFPEPGIEMPTLQPQHTNPILAGLAQLLSSVPQLPTRRKSRRGEHFWATAGPLLARGVGGAITSAQGENKANTLQRNAMASEAAKQLNAHRWDTYKAQKAAELEAAKFGRDHQGVPGIGPVSNDAIYRQNNDGTVVNDPLVRYNPALKPLLGQRVPDSLLDPNSGRNGVAGAESQTAEEIADAITNGLQPPDMKGLYRYGAAVRGALAKRGYDLTKAQLDWQATSRWISSTNGPQQLRLRQAAETAYQSLDVIDQLSTKLSTLVPRGAISGLNRASLAVAKNMPGEAGQVARQLEAQITDVVSELGNVYMGGNSPTDHALQLAGKNLSANWSEAQLRKNVDLARTNLRIRLNSIQTSAPLSQPNPFRPTATPADKVRMTDPQGKAWDVDAAEVADAESHGWKRGR